MKRIRERRGSEPRLERFFLLGRLVRVSGPFIGPSL